jgi:hypothetical protein
MALLSFTQQKKTTLRKKTSGDIRKTARTTAHNIKRSSTKNYPPHSKKIQSPYARKYKRYTKLVVKSLLLSPVFHSTFKVVSVALVSFGLLYASYFFIGKTFANEVVVSKSEIVSRVSILVALPNEEPYEIVRVQDEADLQKQNPFYKDIQEGDYILVYKDMAVIYDLRNNVIKGIKKGGAGRE